MSSWRLALQSFKHYFSVNLAIAVGVAAATAVLTGALLVGDSMRTSLRDLTLERLGEIDELLLSQGFFDTALTSSVKGSNEKLGWKKVVPAILFNNGSVEKEVSDIDQAQRANNVNVFGVPNDFWQLDASELEVKDLQGDVAIINQALADQLGISPSEESATVVLRIPKPTQLPAESALGEKRDLIESLVGLNVVQVLPDEGIARFNLHPSQLDSPNIFVPIALLQDALSRDTLRHKSTAEQANVAFVAKSSDTKTEDVGVAELFLEQRLSRRLEDEGLKLKRVTQSYEKEGASESAFDYWSLSSEQMVLRRPIVEAVTKACPNAKPVFTYLANDIRTKDKESGIPFSMIASIDMDDQFSLKDQAGKPILQPSSQQIVLNQWAANNLGVSVGDEVVVTWYQPETTHGKQVEESATLKVSAVAGLTEPYQIFNTQRGRVIPAKFDEKPTLANDPDLTPEVPGVTDAASIEDWEIINTAGKIRPADDEYWENYRTTPKAFVSLETGQELWNSRFGDVTSFRIPASEDVATLESRILNEIAQTNGATSFELVPLKRNALAASAGSTPFDVLFLALSMFVIGAGLILVSLLFRLALQSRASEIGTLQAVGLTRKQITSIWVKEMILVCIVGAILGVLIGIGYAWLMIWGLKTWWLGAISKPIINLHVGTVSIIAGVVSGILICVGTIVWSLRQLRKQNVRGMLAGRIDEAESTNKSNRGSRLGISMIVALVLAVLLSVVAIGLNGDAQAGAFMGSGFCVLSALLMFIYSVLKKDTAAASVADLKQLAMLSLRRNPLRSTLTIGLVAVASFLIAAVSSFRLTPTDQGTAGYDFVAESSQPIFANLNSAEGQNERLGSTLPAAMRIDGFRFKPGEDASCNNLYQSAQPRVLGVTQSFIDSFDNDRSKFAWGGDVGTTEAEGANAWKLLNRKFDDGAIPVLIDKNTANYSLKIFAPGGDYVVNFDSGEEVRFRVVGFLSNTILQGSLLVSEDNFVKAFPYLGGSRYFLIDNGDLTEEEATAAVSSLEQQLSDEGFDAQSAPKLLANFMAVQNTYLSTFQSLGALGLLLGTFGLAAVQIRNVLERKRELGLMRAVGFPKSRLAKMILIENGWLLGAGLTVGILSALCCTLPHFIFGDASIPWLPLLAIFVAIFIIGLFASFIATRILSRMNLLDSLKA